MCYHIVSEPETHAFIAYYQIHLTLIFMPTKKIMAGVIAVSPLTR